MLNTSGNFTLKSMSNLCTSMLTFTSHIRYFHIYTVLYSFIVYYTCADSHQAKYRFLSSQTAPEAMKPLIRAFFATLATNSTQLRSGPDQKGPGAWDRNMKLKTLQYKCIVLYLLIVCYMQALHTTDITSHGAPNLGT